MGVSPSVFGTDGFLLGDSTSISLGAGGSQGFELLAGAHNAGEFFALFGTFSGTTPGLVMDGTAIPINPDAYTFYSLAPNPFLTGNFGALDGSGEANASLDLPPGSPPSLAGLTAHHAYVTIDLATGGIQIASNPESIDFVP